MQISGGGRPWTGPTFFDTQFCSANLSGVDLRRVDLGTTDFRWSNLTDAQLNKTAENADLEGANIAGCAMNEDLDPNEEPDKDFDDADFF